VREETVAWLKAVIIRWHVFSGKRQGQANCRKARRIMHHKVISYRYIPRIPKALPAPTCSSEGEDPSKVAK